MNYKIPLFQLNFDEQEVLAVTETIRSKWISTGPKCEELETTFAEMLGVKHAISLSNCTDALHLACIVNGIGASDEVLCPSLTFAASVNCIRYVGATPIFCDIRGLHDINIDPEDIQKKITPKTKAIVVVHMAGFPCEMDEIMEIAKKNNLKVIEDACHGPLSEYKDKKLGTIGDVGCFSFFSNKNISTGEGGMIVTNNDEYAERIRLLRSHGMTTMSYQRAKGHATAYDIVELGYNFRMDDIRASIAIVQLKKLQADLDKRVDVRKNYLTALSGIEQIEIPFKNNKEFVSNYIMPIVLKNSTVEKRDALRNYLHENGIQTSNHYPPIHKFSIYKENSSSLPITEYVCENEITLPMYAVLTNKEIAWIAETIKTFFAFYE
ncbi:DegT/DnrJ/EryC1/StrS aminotransferase family protein [Proteiniphilum sp. X52]|uniref:DegT/DnrJ/EryC1/StrS family aminotransferase n=1 Tax=Proteiniphilum sp. X52 TaxID=2382159 RepID=UPI000F0A0132|nr:DegT/DnrJ/EryC1/StrS family aminotransferase [Proteiniphilum sp. X52]RNC64745.1 DegT/DnrJ/EryC1/StrS family aminotransferase [Proteiniphilum sp. X52]